MIEQPQARCATSYAFYRGDRSTERRAAAASVKDQTRAQTPPRAVQGSHCPVTPASRPESHATVRSTSRWQSARSRRARAARRSRPAPGSPDAAVPPRPALPGSAGRGHPAGHPFSRRADCARSPLARGTCRSGILPPVQSRELHPGLPPRKEARVPLRIPGGAAGCSAAAGIRNAPLRAGGSSRVRPTDAAQRNSTRRGP